MQETVQTVTMNKGQSEHQRQMAIRMWESVEAPAARPLGSTRHAVGYAQRRRLEHSHLLQHALGALLVLGTLLLIAKV